MAAVAAEDPAIECAADLAGGPVLETTCVVRGAAVGPAPVDLGPGLLQDEAAPSGLGQVAVLAAQPDDRARLGSTSSRGAAVRLGQIGSSGSTKSGQPCLIKGRRSL